MQEQTMANFSYPGTIKEINPGVHGGYNYRFGNGWVITLCEGGNDLQTLCYVGDDGMLRDINALIECKDSRTDDDKRFLNRAEVARLFKAVSEL